VTAGYDPGVVWLVILAAGLGTFALRLSFLALLGGREPPPALAGALRFVPAAVLSALVVPAVVSLGLDPAPAVVYDPRKVVAAAVAAVVAWRTGSVLATIAVGMGTLWALTLVV